MVGRRPGVIGRDTELAAGDGFLDALAAGPAMLVLEGEPGIGKTTVWSELCGRARDRGHVVLSSQPVQSETELPFAGLLDLLGDYLDDIAELPGPQRRALEIALARSDPEPGESVGSLAASAGFLSVLGRLSGTGPVVVAIDDLQWLDVPTFRVFSFAARRLGSQRIGVLGPVRIPSALDATVPSVDIGADHQRIRLRPLSMASLYHLIDQRLGVSLPRYALARIEAASGGNAIVALEMARVIRSDGGQLHGEGPVPETVATLVSGRVERLPRQTREALLQCSALSRPTTHLVDPAILEPAIQAGLVDVGDDSRIRFAHPLFASAVYSRATPMQRAAVHRWLSERVIDPDEQTLHAALASTDRDGGLAARLHDAAERARGRGAPEFAAELEERAIARTPDQDRGLGLERRLRAAEHHERAGDIGRATAFAEEVLADATDPALRARAHALVAQIAFGQSFPTAIDLLEGAIRQPGAEPASVAQLEIHVGFARMAMVDLAGALPHARRAERLAEAAGDIPLFAEAISFRAYLELIKDDHLDDGAIRRSLELEDVGRESPIQLRPRLNKATIDLLFGRLDSARGSLLELRRAVLESGEEHELPYLANLLAFEALLRGDWVLADEYIAEALRTAIVVRSETLQGFAIAVRSLAAAYAGEIEGARADAQRATAIFDRVNWGIGRFYVAKAMSVIAMSLDRPADVERDLGPLEATLGRSVAFAGPAYFYGDLIEAMVAGGRSAAAARLTDGLVTAARAVDSPMALAVGLRGSAWLASSRGRHAEALEAIAGAETVCRTMPIPSELGRTLLARGQMLRRMRRKHAAEETLTAAREIFSEFGMPLWVARTHAELARIGLRRASRSELTETERRIAELAASGLTNREIAAKAFVSPRTVEDVMARVYGKLGIRSRAELGARMADRS